MPRRSVLRIAIALAALCSPQAVGADEARPVEDLSLEELMNATVVSASNTREQLGDAPATVVVITREEIRQRGYLNLSEVLDDLPGMDMVRPWGDTFLKDYWRGYRNTIGEPFLILLDGVVFNHLYFNTAEVGLTTFPLSNIERVEVVYGPASSVYGPNAFMGVINVITRPETPAPGASHHVSLTAGSSRTRIVDATASWAKDDVRLSATVRLEESDLDDAHVGAYEYTKPAYYADRRLWGGFVDNPNITAGPTPRFLSPNHERALELRAAFGGAEAGFDMFRLNTGYGVEYAADSAQSNAVWSRPEMDAFLRFGHALGGRTTSSTLVRYRQSGLSADSTFLESYTVEGPDGPERVADFSYWQSLNSSWSAFEDVEVRASTRLFLTGGAKYEQKDLQKAYDNPYGPTVPVDQLDASAYPFPAPPGPAEQAPNRITTEDIGVHGQARYQLSDGMHANFGLRYDHNSQYGGATNVRAGFVARHGRWGGKALYGEAFQEPVPRLLYGGWKGSGSDPHLLPERSRTVELSGSYTGRQARGLLSVYRVANRDTIVSTTAGAQNLGDRTVLGADVHAQAQFGKEGRSLKLWGYYSHILQADEDETGGGAAIPIGDLARSQAHLGVTGALHDRWTASLRARWVGDRDTVASNPVRSVPSWATVDLALGADDVIVRGLGVWLRVSNALDAEYFEPGVREASAGDTPGTFDARGAWSGAQGFYSSLLPQPGRAILLTLRLSTD